MKTIGKDELYHNVSAFMKAKGIELTDGAYAAHIRQGCGLLSDAINAAQRAVTRAKKEVDAKLAQLRQCIHDATAPSQPSPAPPPPPPPAPTAAAPGKPPAKASRKPSKPAKTAPPARRPRRPRPPA